jgi:hypothetical protein
VSYAAKKEWLLNEAATDIYKVAVAGADRGERMAFFDFNWTLARLKRLATDLESLVIDEELVKR